MSKLSHAPYITVIIALALMMAPLSTSVVAGESGLAIGPALMLVRDAPPGRPFTLQEVAKTKFHLINHATIAGDFKVECTIPTDPGLRVHEMGYHAPPDASWFSLDKKLIHLEPGEKVEFDLHINIPDRPELYNQHWVLYIDATVAAQKGTGAALRLRARVMLDTMVKAGIGAAIEHSGSLGLDPGTITMVPQDGIWQGQVRARNNTTQSVTYDVMRMDEVIPNNEKEKRARYFSHALMAERDPIGRPQVTTLTLAPGEEKLVSMSGKSESPLSGMVEEVIFFSHRAEAGVDPKICREFAGRLYDQASFVRLQFPVQKTETPEKPK